MATPPALRLSWLDRLTATVAPRWTNARIRARLATELLARSAVGGAAYAYEASAVGRRTQGWRRTAADANVTIGPALVRLRENARDLVRNNPYAESALSTICDHAVGTGIIAKPETPSPKAAAIWRAWAETTACDADGRHDFYGLQKLVMRTVVESGEVLVRQRIRRPEDGFPLPMQLQVLDPDFLDTSRTNIQTPNGGQIINGVEFDPIGRRVAYWLFPAHPGSLTISTVVFGSGSVRVPADGVLHIFRPNRPGQVRGPSWFAPVLLRFKDFDEFEDATLMKQKIAACLAVLTSDPTGSAPPLGTADDTATPPIDSLEPGMILNIATGRTIDVVQPPSVTDYPNYAQTVLRAIATGLGVTYEDLTGDYANMPFSSARMSRLRHWARVEDWRWRILIPQFCDPVWAWAMQTAAVMNQAPIGLGAEWTAPPPPMVDPAVEGLAFQRNIRTGIQSLSDAIRERGYDPDTLLAEIAADNKKLDALGIVLDSDPRKMTQAGQSQAALGGGAPAPVADGAPGDQAPPPGRAWRDEVAH